MRMFLAFCLLFACQPLLARPADDVNSTVSASSPVPMRLAQGYVVIVPGRIGSGTCLQFVLDTGASRTVIDRSVAKRLAISVPVSSNEFVVSFDKRVAVETAEVRGLEIGPLQIPELTVTIGDLRYFRSFAGQVDGVIGLDVLTRSSFTIDFAARQVAFGTKAADLPAAKRKTHTVKMTREPDYFSVEIETEALPLEMAVDTGVRGIVLYQDHLTDHGIDYRVIETAFGMRLGGVLRSNVAVLDRLAINGQGLDPRVILTEAPLNGGHPRLDGFFGLASLEARGVSFDFERGILSWWN